MARRRRAVEQAPKVRVDYWDLNDITPYPDNPRDNDQAVQSVANSIKAFGFLVPIVVDGEGVVVAGHTRLEAAKSLGLHEAPVIVADSLTEDQVKQFRIIDNKVSELARWDMDLLSGELGALQNSGIVFTDFGFTQDEIDCLTEVVADDCLAAGTVSDDMDAPRNREVSRGPGTTRFVLGEYVFFIPAEAYRTWVSGLRSEFDFQEEDILREIKSRLGLPVGANL